MLISFILYTYCTYIHFIVLSHPLFILLINISPNLIISTQRVKFPFNELRIEIDCSVSNSWVEIDAVEIVGGTI